MARTLGTLLSEARTLLQDKVALNETGQPYRYTDAELFEALNGAFAEARAKRPDLFLTWGLRNPLPYFSVTTDLGVPWPLDVQYYNAFVYYIVGRTELREDTFSQDSRAVALMNKFLSQLTVLAS
jgi:hypothetical protein